MNKEYVSEFTAFMNHYLEDHPEVVREQHRGWRIYWDHKVDLTEQEHVLKDSVPNDGYGFYWPAWHGEPLPKTEGSAR